MALRRRKRSEEDNSGNPVPGLTAVYEQSIFPHIFSNADREVGGVLVGRTADSGPVPQVRGAIPAISADEQRATLTFTQESWEHVHRVLDTEYPEGEQIVGWYHSHPSFGIFLSGHDLFIHQNFFSGSSQIAVVVDPIGCTEGTFVWQDGEIVPLYEQATPDHWEAQVAPPDHVALQRDVTQPAVEQGGRFPVLATVVATVIGLLVGFGLSGLVAGDSDSDSPAKQAQPAAVQPGGSE